MDITHFLVDFLKGLQFSGWLRARPLCARRRVVSVVASCAFVVSVLCVPPSAPWSRRSRAELRRGVAASGPSWCSPPVRIALRTNTCEHTHANSRLRHRRTDTAHDDDERTPTQTTPEQPASSAASAAPCTCWQRGPCASNPTPSQLCELCRGTRSAKLSDRTPADLVTLHADTTRRDHRTNHGSKSDPSSSSHSSARYGASDQTRELARISHIAISVGVIDCSSSVDSIDTPQEIHVRAGTDTQHARAEGGAALCAGRVEPAALAHEGASLQCVDFRQS